MTPKERTWEECDEKCNKCGWIHTDLNDTAWGGAPISGTYQECPKCGNYWTEEAEDGISKGYTKVNIIKHEEVILSKKDYKQLQKENQELKDSIKVYQHTIKSVCYKNLKEQNK